MAGSSILTFTIWMSLSNTTNNNLIKHTQVKGCGKGQEMKKADLGEFERLSEQFHLIPLYGKIAFEDEWEYYCENSRFYDEKEFKGHNAGNPLWSSEWRNRS